ncbi:MAG: histidine phosphatase family protein [Xanthobacteraceae bacterium]|jgi:phosphohistidine phosphatase|nr:histidine phosphatase family protein [Xanthobacteraceae bacterium]
MRRLLLLRHAKSDWPDGYEDALRPLAERGRRDAPEMGKAIARSGIVPDLALVSTSVRTRQTWELLAPQLGKEVRTREESGLYGAPEKTLLDFARFAPDEIETLLLCAHNPGMERLARSFAKSGNPDAIRRVEKKYPTCALAVIELPVNRWKDAAPPAGRLEMFLTPATLAD